MKLRIALFVTVFMFAVPASAQVDLFAGYSLGMVDFGSSELAHGFTLAGSGAINENLVIEGDFTFQSGSAATGFGGINFDVMTITAGPRFTLGGDIDGKKFKPYVHALAGMGRLSALGGSSTDFALVLGGGVDVPTSNKVDFRFGVDYVPVFATNTMNNIRIVAGVVFRWGDE